MRYLIYVSRNLIEPHATCAEMERIVAGALQRNAALRITGALVTAGDRNLQYLEGPEAELAELMRSIVRDPRHEQVQVIADRGVQTRRFPNWRLAYCGGSEVVRRTILAAADDAAKGGRDWTDDLIDVVEDCIAFPHLSD